MVWLKLFNNSQVSSKHQYNFHSFLNVNAMHASQVQISKCIHFPIVLPCWILMHTIASQLIATDSKSELITVGRKRQKVGQYPKTKGQRFVSFSIVPRVCYY